MKIIKKITTIFLSVCCAFSVFGAEACKTSGGISSGSGGSKGDSASFADHICGHVCEICGKCKDESCTDPVCKDKCSCKKGLHERKIGTAYNTFVSENGTSEYVVLYDGTVSEAQTAAGFIASNVNSAIGKECLKTAAYEESVHSWSADRCYVAVGVTALFESAGLSVPENADLSGAGYYIKTEGKSVFIETGDKAGFQMGAIAFLEELIGYDMLNYTGYTVYEKVTSGEEVRLYEMEITEKPDFMYRVKPSSTIISSATTYGMGYTNANVFIQKDFREYHNTFCYLPPDRYYGEHPEWYGPTVNASMNKNTLNNGQLCYTAGGRTYDEDGKPNGTYGEMLATVAESMIEEIQKNFNAGTNNIAFTAQDSSDWCNCAACTEEQNKYGANSANCIIFCNDLEKLLNATLKELGIDREMKIYFFAYLTAVSAPVVQNADGSYSPVDETVRCNKNVGVIYCPVSAKFYYPLNSEVNSTYAEQLKKWGAVCENVAVWLYEVHFENFFYPYCSWQTIADNARFCFENNANYFFNQDQFNIDSPLGFTDLKLYLNAKMSFNTSYNQLDYVKKYFKYSYGEAGDAMYRLYREVQIYYEELHRVYPSVADGSLKEKIANKRYWPKPLLEYWLGIIDEAYEDIAELALTDPSLYKECYDKINLESLPYRYMLCSLYESEYSEEEIFDLRTAFKKDCDYFGIDRTKEATPDLESIYKSWGII